MEKMSFDSIHSPTIDVFPRRANTIHTTEESHVHTVTVYMHVFNPENQQDRIVVELQKRSTTEELIEKVLESRKENAENEELQKAEEYELYEMIGTVEGQTFKERRLDRGEYPVAVQLIWSRQPIGDETAPRNRFVLRHGASRAVVEGIRFRSIDGGSTIDNFLAKFLTQPQDREYADLCMLPELTEQTLLHNLRDRFNSGHIYTYIGPILVAVNPFSFFPIYNPKYARLYCQSRNLGALPPHIFAIADVTYHNMLRIKENQCVVISGESGSGKTESTNHLLSHLITLSQKGSTGCSTELTLLNAAPVLEAFGNAVTLQNNNSSRFGKFIKINYRENGMVSGANVEIYLLEKSRIISQAKGERNYHVFYYLLEGCTDEEKKKYYLMKPKDYHYLNQNGVISVESINEKGEMEKLRKAMGSVGFCKETQNTVFSMISAVLLLGNVNYVKRHAYHSDENAYIENEEVVDMIAELLQIKRDLLLQALTMKRHIMKAETVVTRFSVNEATNTRDAMAKCLYNALFHWIVLRINEALIRRETLGKGYYIGILDIFGFEDVGAQWNSFEQLCINYANEHLQAYFNQHIFEFEQEEYRKEGIRWTDIEYTDNTECVQLFQSKPYGILRLIDEESNINTGTDESMLAKLNQFLKGNEYYETPQKKEPAFIVAHYAGKVKYQITGFREKNKDLMRQDVLNALRTSKSALLKAVLASDPIALHRWSIVRAVFRGMFAFRQKTRRLQRSESDFLLRVAPEEPKRRGSDSALSAFLRGELQLELPDFVDTSMFSTIVKNARRTPGAKSEDKLSTLKCLQILKETMGRKRISNKPTSVSKQFEHSLSRLMSTLAQATPYFIRCIKSNSEKIPNHFDDNIILRQLRYTGMLETVRIRRAGFSVRIEYTAFIQQYRILLKNGLQSSIEDVKEFIHNHPSLESDNVEYGVSKIFMRDAEKLILDDHLHKTIMQHISTLQQWFRAQIARKRYLRMKSAITKLQALIRGMLVRERIRRQAYAACIIQTNWRRYLAQSKYQLIRDAIIAIQAAFRGSKARKKFGEIPRKGKNTFRVQRVQAVTLPTFNLNDPRSLEAFASSDEESEGSTQAALDESDTSELGDDAIELDATFILEDTRLKLIDEPEPSLHTQRRQSLAATASTAKLKMIRRANSTESNTVMMREEPLKPLHLFSKKKATSKIAFTKAKKNLKALFGGRRDEEEKDEPSTSKDLNAVDKWTQHDWKICRLHRQEMCVVCGRNLPSFIIQAHKCQKCKMCVHRECISHTHKVACFPMSPRSPTRMPWDIVKTRHSNSPLSNVAAAAGTFSLTKTKQQTDPGTMIVECIEDLRDFSVFIFKKQSTLEENKSKRATIVDALFKKSLREFHMELIGYEAVLTEEHASLKYHDLITTFEGVLTKVCREEKVTFPTTLGVNAFRGFLNEFAQVQKRKGSRQKTASNKSIRKKRRRSDVTVTHLGHRFRADTVHVPTYCEVCSQFMWHTEKMFICVACRITCHKKCHTKVNAQCPLTGLPLNTPSGRFFGAVLSSLVDEEHEVPILIDRLFICIETKALFVEGVYRKSGSIAQVRSARKMIETTKDLDDICLDDVAVHVLTTLIKSFFRELTEPLITFDLYENFLNVAEVEEASERVRCLSVMIELLPKAHRSLLDRLMYHLARVAHQEAVNKMGASNLALIFGPCILRRHESIHAQDQLSDVTRQAVCIQTLIEEKMKQYRATLINIVQLEDASEKVSENLRRIEEHQQQQSQEEDHPSPGMDTAKQLFTEQLDFLGRQKERLLQELPPLAPVASSEDLSSSDESHQAEEYALDLSAPPILTNIPHLCKQRPRPPANRRPPTLALLFQKQT